MRWYWKLPSLVSIGLSNCFAFVPFFPSALRKTFVRAWRGGGGRLERVLGLSEVGILDATLACRRGSL